MTFKGIKYSLYFGFGILPYLVNMVLSAADTSDISRLRAKILNGYDNYSRPVQNHTDTILVNINFYHNGFDVDEHRNMLTLNVLSVLTWEDHRAQWDPLMYGNLTEVTFFPTELWRPDITVINNFDNSEIDHFSNTLMIVYHDSLIWWIPPSRFRVHCDFDFRLWPYDSQTCTVILSSWTHLGSEIDLSIPDNISELIIDESWEIHFTENTEWKYVGSLVERHIVAYYCCPRVPILEILITVNIQRRYSSHTAAITVVGLAIAAAILIGFWLDPFAHERLPLNLLVLLLNSIYLQHMHRVIPNNGSSVPLAVSFFRDSLIMATFAVAWTVGIRYVARIKRNSPIPLPEFVQTFINSCAATVLCLNPRPQSKVQAQRKLKESSDGDDDGDVSELVQDESGNMQENWEWLARFLDRIAFFLYLITYTVFIAAFL